MAEGGARHTPARFAGRSRDRGFLQRHLLILREQMRLAMKAACAAERPDQVARYDATGVDPIPDLTRDGLKPPDGLGNEKLRRIGD